MGGLFGGAKQSMPAMPPVIQYVMAPETIREEVPAPTSDEAKDVAAAEKEKQRKAGLAAKGAAATVLTGGLGVKEEAPVKRKQLFGE
jgi:hypothetical protein